MFHSVTKDPIRSQNSAHVEKREFAQYMGYLERNGYNPISCVEWIAIRARAKASPTKPVVLTFDDGYAEMFENAHPMLNARGWGYTVFLVAERVGKTSDWEGGGNEALLSWEQIRQMQAAGVDFGAHSLTHPSLPKIAPEGAKREVQESKKALEDALGAPIRSFAYPYGHYSKAVRAMVEEAGYELAVNTQHGRIRPSDHPLELPRVSVYHVPVFSLKFGPRMMNFRWRLETRKDIRPER